MGRLFRRIGCVSPHRRKVCKALEIKELRLEFGCDYRTKIESPAGSGLGFFPDLIVSRSVNGHYSSRITAIGSMCVARRAGMRLAANATTINSAVTALKVRASWALTP